MMKMNPICERASRAAARTPRFSAALFGGNALLAAMALFMLGLVFQRTAATGELRYEELLRVFHTLIWAELAFSALLVPARAAGAVSGEREQRTLDLLLGTALSPRRIILGNLLQNMIGAGIFVLSGLPVLFTVLLFGGVGLLEIAYIFLGLLLSAALSGSLGLFFSAINRTTAVAIVETYAAEALLFFAPYGVFVLAKSFGSAGQAVSWLLLLSPVSLMENLLFHATGLHDFGALAESSLLQQGLLPAAFLELLMMALLLLLAVRAISPRRRKRKFTTEQNLIK